MPKKKLQLVSTKASPLQNPPYINPTEPVNEERLVDIVRSIGSIDAQYQEKALEIIERLCLTVIPMAAYGDEECETQLTAILKLVNSTAYEVPKNKIKELTRYGTRAPLARAWELYRYMSDLTNVVEPRHSNRPFHHNHPVKMRANPRSSGYQEMWFLVNDDWKPNSTLQSIAIRMYLDYLQKEEITSITDRVLKHDLELAREWENNTSEDEKKRWGRVYGDTIGSLTITWYSFNEGWKVRAKEKAGRKQKGTLSEKGRQKIQGN